MFLGDCLVSWKIKKQSIVSKSSAEAEYGATTATISELLWLSYIHTVDFKITNVKDIPLFCNNKSAIQMLENPVHHEKTKHIDIDCHFSRYHYGIGFVKPIYIKSAKQIANMFTK